MCASKNEILNLAHTHAHTPFQTEQTTEINCLTEIQYLYFKKHKLNQLTDVSTIYGIVYINTHACM